MHQFAKTIESETKQNGQLEAGFLSATITNIGTKKALINGVTLAPGERKVYPFVGKGYHSIDYQTGGTTLQVLRIV